MKKLLTIAFSLFVTSVFAQSINPKQLDLIKPEILTGKPTDFIPYINNENMVFSADGHYLFITHVDQKNEGRIIVYSTKIKDVVKTFRVKKTGKEYFDGNIICNQNNENQIALVANSSEIMVIQNWQTAPEDILLQKPSDKCIAIKASLRWSCQMDFSKDGKQLYIIENQAKTLKIADLATGKVTIPKLPDGKEPFIAYHISTFIGNDNIIVSKVPKKKENRIIEIYNLSTKQFISKHECPSTPQGTIGNPQVIYFQNGNEQFTLNLLTGEKDATITRVIKSLKGDNTSLDIHPIPGKGYVLAYLYYDEKVTKSGSYKTTTTKSQTGLFFFDNNGNNVTGYFPSVNSKVPAVNVRGYQISRNGKYMIFKHDDPNENKNDRLVIATL